MVYVIDYGHTLKGSVGARGNGHKEEECTREIGKALTSILRRCGHVVHEVFNDESYTVYDDITSRVKKINSIKPDISISIHLNAFSDANANGVEVWCKENSKNAAGKILNAICELGYRNRGIKDGSSSLGLVSLYGGNTPALLIECGFITNKEDMDRYNPEYIANAIAKALIVDYMENKEIIKCEYKEQGTFYPDRVLHFRNSPDSNSPIQGTYQPGEKVNYDWVVITSHNVYISWVSDAYKIRRYMPVRTVINGKAQKLNGVIK